MPSARADDVLRQGVQGISDIITIPGLINVDFADVKAVMSNAGDALMGIGFAEGDHRATEAAQLAVSSPLLETEITGASAVLVNVTAGLDLTLAEVYEAADLIGEKTNAAEANIIFGTVVDPRLAGAVRITVLATGYGAAKPREDAPMMGDKAASSAPPPADTPTLPTPMDDRNIEIPPFLRRRV